MPMLVLGQGENQKTQSSESGDVQLGTTLAQTDLMVFTKDGRFVDNLKREQFELLVNGKSESISFFELIASGTTKEEKQLAAARGERVPAKAIEAGPREIGRSIFFFVDDLHLSADSTLRTRKLLLDYVNNHAYPNDKVAILTASGQLGFLQQLCDNKAVLRAAINRLAYRAPNGLDQERPIMTESQAIDLQAGDRDVLDYFVSATMKEFPGQYTKITAERYVKSRSQRLTNTAGMVTISTLSSLESFLRDVSQLSGRKLAFFVSDGFMVKNRSVDAIGKLNDVIYRASLAGVVFYTLDARGLVTGLPDASSNATPDPTGQSLRGMSNSILDAQDGLNSLAVDTGGRAIRNTNGLDTSVTTILSETSQYYMLAWQWGLDDSNKDKFKKIQIKIKDHPEYIVRARQRVFASPTVTTKSSPVITMPGEVAAVPQATETQMVDLIKASYPKRDLPATIYPAFLLAPDKSTALMLAVRIPGSTLDAKESGNALQGDVTLMAMIFNDHGKEVANFKEKVPLSQTVSRGQSPVLPDLNYNKGIILSPGIYQIRVAARDNVSGMYGGTQEWIEIPDPAGKHLTLSTPFIGESSSSGSDFRDLSLKIDKEFMPGTNLRFMSYVYNATIAQSGPSSEVVGDARVLRNNKPVVVSKSRAVSTAEAKPDGHLTYADELSLKGLPSGAYTLELTITDHAANAKTIQEINFTIK